ASRGLPLLDDPSPGGLAGVGGSLTLEAVNLGGNQELTGAGGLAGAGIHPSGPIQPSEVESYQWTVEELGGLSFRKTFVVDRFNRPYLTRVRLPRQGRYVVNLDVNLKDGSKVSSSPQFYRLRDFLVVSIGDSFASGEGN